MLVLLDIAHKLKPKHERKLHEDRLLENHTIMPLPHLTLAKPKPWFLKLGFHIIDII
jgi:hypothetical protein